MAPNGEREGKPEFPRLLEWTQAPKGVKGIYSRIRGGSCSADFCESNMFICFLVF